MLKLKKTDLGKQTKQFDVSVPFADIQKSYDTAFDEIAKELTVEGFRKGAAPKDMAEKQIKKEEVYRKVIDQTIPKVYEELICQESLKPIVQPKVELISAKENEDWVIRITVAEKPEIKLNTYKDAVKAVKADQKKDAIWVPGKDGEKPKEQDEETKRNETLNKILDQLIKKTDVPVSDMIVEAEVEKKLSQLVDDVRKVGLTIEAYLKSKNETVDSIKAKFTAEISDMYKLELLLEEIAESEKISVEKDDLEKIFKNITDEKGRAEAEKNAYFYASVVRRQKTLDFLMNL